MNIKELKEVIADLPDDMPVGLLDLTTDDFHNCNYGLKKEDLTVGDYVKEEGDEVSGKALYLCFENKLNENPIN